MDKSIKIYYLSRGGLLNQEAISNLDSEYASKVIREPIYLLNI